VSADLEAAARRLRLALDLLATGEALMREKLRREHPEVPPAESLDKPVLLDEVRRVVRERSQPSQ